MAKKEYSPKDKEKVLRDLANDLSARGGDIKEICLVNQGTFSEGVLELRREKNGVVDQSIAQTERNRRKK